MPRLTRKFEQELPDFQSHTDARKWFKKRFGDNFVLTDSQIIDGEKIYFYHLIIDRTAYESGMKKLSEEGYVSGMDLPMSYHPIEISETGLVHIVY